MKNSYGASAKYKRQIKVLARIRRGQEATHERIFIDNAITAATLRIQFTADKVCQMYYKLADETDFTKIPFSSIPKDHTWVGAKTGIFSTALEPCNNQGFADFTEVVVKALS